MAQSCFQTIPKLSLITSTPSPSCAFLFVVILCILGLYSLHHHPTSIGRPTQASASPNDLHFRDVFLTSATNTTLSGYLRALTLHPHLAGTTPALQTALYVQTHFRDLGLETHVKDYNALLSYPTHTSLSLHFNDGSVEDVSLAEPGVAGDDLVRPYHAYSPSGSAYGMPVFVNYGREEDYRALAAQGVSVAGCVAVARRGEEPRNVVTEKAAEKGAAAVLMYAETTAGFKGGVERGTVMKGLGDPLTPGWGGVDDGERLGVDDNEVVKRFPKIPSMPISAASAEKILRSLEGGKVPYQWRDTPRLKKVGPGPTMLNFTYQGVKKMVTIHNVFAIIRGSEEPDRFVLLGNHRDAWTYGAVDPNSGTAALLDIARRYALLLRLGWNPRRSIILCSWDAEEFGMVEGGGRMQPSCDDANLPRMKCGERHLTKCAYHILLCALYSAGSTEWVEQNLVNLGSKAVAYLNVDCAVQGPGFFAGATPQLDDLLVEVMKKVKDPDSEDMTLYKRWTTTNKGINIQRLSGVDSDFAPFLQHAGVPSVDLYYGRDFPVYHTAFDSYDWMTNYGDPLFQRHVAVTGVWGLLALHLADDVVLPLNYLSYAAQLQEYTNVLSNLLEGSVSLHPITASIRELVIAAKAAKEEAKKLREQEAVDNLLVLKKRALNDRLMFAERGFLDAEGLQGRQWFKHLVYGPKSDHESKLVFFPGIVDAISESRRMNKRDGEAAIQHEIWRVARAIQRAAYALRGELT